MVVGDDMRRMVERRAREDMVDEKVAAHVDEETPYARYYDDGRKADGIIMMTTDDALYMTLMSLISPPICFFLPPPLPPVHERRRAYIILEFHPLASTLFTYTYRRKKKR